MNRRALLIAPVLLAVLLAGCRSFGPPAGRKASWLLGGPNPARDARLLLSPDAEVRRWSILRLAEYGDTTALTAIAALLDPSAEPVPLVRATAAVGLRMLGDKRAVPYLLRACDDPDPCVRADVLRSLGMLGHELDLGILSRRLASDRDPDVRLQALLAIARIGGKDALAPLVVALEDPDISVAFAAHSKLIELTGQDLPPSRAAWDFWMQGTKKPRTP